MANTCWEVFLKSLLALFPISFGSPTFGSICPFMTTLDKFSDLTLGSQSYEHFLLFFPVLCLIVADKNSFFFTLISQSTWKGAMLSVVCCYIRPSGVGGRGRPEL